MTLAQWNIFSYTDVLEIIIFCYGSYRFTAWLNMDTTKNLIAPWYHYLGVIIISYLLHMQTLHAVSLCYAPVACCLFFIIHQKTLQKNVIVPSRSYSQKEDFLSHAWVETLVQGCILHFNEGKDLLVVISKNDVIDAYMQASEQLRAPLSRSLMSLLLESKRFDSHKFLWMDTTGKAIALNAELIIPAQVTQDGHYYHLPEWKQKALCLTKTTDSIILKACHASRSFDVIVESKIYEDLNTQSICTLLEYYTKNDSHNERYINGMEHKKSSEHQPSS